MTKTLFEYYENGEKKFDVFEWNSTEENIKAFVSSHESVEHFQAYPLSGTIIKWGDDISSWKIPAKKWSDDLEKEAWDEEMTKIELEDQDDDWMFEQTFCQHGMDSLLCSICNE